MKVLIFMTQFYQLSGAELSVVELAEELNMRGIHTDILSMYTENLPGVSEAKEGLLEKGIPTVHFLGMRVHPPIASMVPAILRLRRLVREQGYDVVETSMLSPSVIASWALRGIGVAHVVAIRHVYRRNRENSKQHKFLRFSVRCNGRIRYYAISDHGREHWIEYSGTLPENCRTIHNSIPDSFFSVSPDRQGLRQELGVPRDARLAIYVGRYAAYKGIDTLLCALGPVLAHHNMYLLYVGSPDLSVAGTGTMLQRMETRIAHENWSEEVRFLGRREDVPRLLASADVLVHATRTEAFGRTLAEALAVGLPVVASNVEAIPEVLAGTDSIMVPPDDPQALREAVLKTLNRTPDEAAQAIEKGRKRAESFRIEKRTDVMIRLFEEVTSGEKGKGRSMLACETNNKLRILIIGSLPPPFGGTTVSLRYLVNALKANREVEVRVVDTGGVRGSGMRGLFRLAALPGRILAAVHKVDVVTLHCCSPSTLGLPVLFLSRLFRKPLIVHKFGGNDYRESLGWRSPWLSEFVLRQAEIYLAETHQLVEQAKARGLNRVRWFPTYRPFSKPGDGSKGTLASACRRFVYVGHVREYKGMRVLVEAAKNLPEGVIVDVYGPCFDDLDRRVFDDCPNIEYRGTLDPDEVIPTMQVYDAFVLPTIASTEGYPGAVLEAYAAGLPIIASKIGGIPEIVDDNVGILVKPRNAGELCEAMTRLAEDRELYQRLRANTREKAEFFSVERWAAIFAEHCRNLAFRGEERS